ncbi:Glycosyltransferase family 28 domain protein [Theileria parva strain Muguga]|uniref:UDP-N-acetylglucosamine transferase subunit ALG13 n=1 Tax=Theileria parva TaxID=5875 RepID=Q4N4X5_THEPA|nr:Glycosyltransferase family 28 domain protein [Theileria parva strain Muguga]EAN32798.1 Glycosyltransferase family 28 domain protein [Theileria parva strain Muguga]|eukprot:XP_765081.1 hypothetical protein [Theileria parva strain Muguga]
MPKESSDGSRTVLVTVGTSSFDSLIRRVDEEDFQQELKSLGYTNVIYQIGIGKYYPKTSILPIVVKQYLDNFTEYVKNADLVISHLGSGNLLEVFSHQKYAVFVPNPDVAGNHQIELLHVLDHKFISDLDSLKEKVKNPGKGTGNFFPKLLPKTEFNSFLTSILTSKI